MLETRKYAKCSATFAIQFFHPGKLGAQFTGFVGHIFSGNV
jgi:hypothetical protein